MKLLTTITLILIYSTCLSQGVFEKSIYELVNSTSINFKHKDDTSNFKIYLRESSKPALGPIISEKTLSIFKNHLTDKDINYMLGQKDTSYMIWDQDKLGQATVLDEENVKTNKPIGVYLIEKPLFSIDMNYAIIKISYNCGSNCYESCFFLYRKEINSWKNVQAEHCIIS